jgi:hypothetical protein
MLRPGRKADCAGSRMLCSARVCPRRVARILFTSLAKVGPTDIGRRSAVESRGPSHPGLGSPVTVFSFSCAGMSRASRHRFTIAVTMKGPAVGDCLVGELVGVDASMSGCWMGTRFGTCKDVGSLAMSGSRWCVGSFARVWEAR